MKPNRAYKILIGIDCGVNTGICVWLTETKTVRHISSVMINHAMNSVVYWHHNYPGGVKVRVEDARKRKWIPRQATEKAERGRREGAGSVKRDAKIWEDFLEDIKVDYEMVAPKNNKTKVNADFFKKISKYSGPTNEHGRDAGMLVIGM